MSGEDQVGDRDNDSQPWGEGEKPEWWRWRPEFELGNELAMQHGAYSPRRVDPLAESLVQTVLVDARSLGSTTAYLAEASFRPALLAWARAEARCQLVTEWLMDNGGDIAAGGEVRAPAEYLRRWENQALKHREQLGLSPLARARMGRDVAARSVDMAKVMAELEAEEQVRTSGSSAGPQVDVGQVVDADSIEEEGDDG